MNKEYLKTLLEVRAAILATNYPEYQPWLEFVKGFLLGKRSITEMLHIEDPHNMLYTEYDILNKLVKIE